MQHESIKIKSVDFLRVGYSYSQHFPSQLLLFLQRAYSSALIKHIKFLFILDRSFSIQHCSPMMQGEVLTQSGFTLLDLTMRSLPSTAPAHMSDAVMERERMHNKFLPVVGVKPGASHIRVKDFNHWDRLSALLNIELVKRTREFSRKVLGAIHIKKRKKKKGWGE